MTNNNNNNNKYRSIKIDFTVEKILSLENPRFLRLSLVDRKPTRISAYVRLI